MEPAAEDLDSAIIADAGDLEMPNADSPAQSSQLVMDEFTLAPELESTLQELTQESAPELETFDAEDVEGVESGQSESSRLAATEPSESKDESAPVSQSKADSPWLHGIVDTVDVAGETAIIRFGNSVTPPRRARVLVTHRYILGRLQTIGEFEITDIASGMATIRPIAGMSVKQISTGDTATVMSR